MIVLEDNIEFEFLINTPIVGQSVASLPRQVDDGVGTEDNNNTDAQEQNNNDESETGVNDQSNVDDDETITDVESLFN